MHINEKGQTALTLVDGLGDIGITSVYQHDTLTIMSCLGLNLFMKLILNRFPCMTQQIDAKNVLSKM